MLVAFIWKTFNQWKSNLGQKWLWQPWLFFEVPIEKEENQEYIGLKYVTLHYWHTKNICDVFPDSNLHSRETYIKAIRL